LPKQAVDILNDIWVLNRSGVASISGVNMYGDVRTFSESFAIDDRIELHWSKEAFVEYYSSRGQMWICIGGKVYVAHTKAPTEGINRARYPWSEFKFNFVPSCFGQWEDMVIGSADGFIYKVDSSTSKDDGEDYYMSIKTKYYQSPFKLIDVLETKVLIDSRTGTSFDFVAYKDNNTFEEVHRWEMQSALHDDVIINDLGDAIIDDMTMAMGTLSSPMTLRLGFTCFAYQMHLDNIKSIGIPIFIDGIIVRYRPMED